ncbi:dnaJ homolog subfamily C member 4 [Pelobates cultripes]|uniref:DnaJ homolog subfamily C member 4 n=1 Tax=Pelobates cultripes TaxID=61616 RepID=A0AAD1THH8_PELCU|nr:dnaJ homolog subfamily C member 4 [Pelobates cultripes]
MMLCRCLIKRQVLLGTTWTQCCVRAYSRPDLQDHYQILGVEKKATDKEIKNAFFIQSKKLHPDSNPSNPLLHAEFVRLNEAYKVLSRDSSRRQYDKFLDALKREHWVPGRDNSTFQNRGSSYRPASEDNAFYWTQFSQGTGASTHQRKRRNSRLVWFCILLMTGSMIAHYVGFSILRKVHKEFVDEQQKRLLKIYNETKMAARANGIKKQHEIFLQKQAAFMEKYRQRNQGDETKK